LRFGEIDTDQITDQFRTRKNESRHGANDYPTQWATMKLPLQYLIDAGRRWGRSGDVADAFDEVNRRVVLGEPRLDEREVA
jgi:hypothetical protein